MSGNRERLRAVMPAMFLHEGWWDGWYRHFNLDGTLIDEHRVKTQCDFPDEGDFYYRQHNWLSWADGRTAEYRTGATMEDDRLIWDGENFSGYGWQTSNDLIMLRLDRRDVANAYYSEMIEIAQGGNSRARTWQWFKDGEPWKRTLCDETRIEGPAS